VAINEGITDKATGASRQPQAHAVNEQLQALGAKNGVDVIDWNQTIAVNGGNPAVTFDTVHLSTKGVVLLAHTYKDALAKC
jgi:lysophospholipase L1-like esterase